MIGYTKNNFCKYFISVFFFILCTAGVKAQTRHALIFAIGNYPDEKGWPSPLSSLRDVEVIKTALVKQQFDTANIHILRDKQVTPAGIADTFKQLLSSKKMHKGDIVVIHVSTHGEQVEDDNGDEVDRLDECIVTYNALSPYLAKKKDFQKNQKEYFRDDQFGDYIEQLRDSLGSSGDILVFIDACHSGSGTRGIDRVRGGQPALVSETFDSLQEATVDIKGVFREGKAAKNDEKGKATYVVFSAARADELDHEAKGKGLGSLSYAIGKVFERLDPGTTYRSLFAKIESVMNEVAPTQHPVLEGNGIDRELFGGRFIKQKPYVEIEKIKDNRIVIKAGVLSGLDIGAKVVVDSSGTKDPARVTTLASGTVTRAENYSSTVTLDKNPGITNPNQGWVFVTEPVYNSAPIQVDFVSNTKKNALPGFTPDEISVFKSKLKDLPLFRFDGDTELQIVKTETKDSIRIKLASNGYVFKTICNHGSVADTLKDQLLKYTQYKFLRDVEINDTNATVRIRLVPVINRHADTSKIESKIINGIYEFYSGDKFVLWIKNMGESDVYINILDLQPDGIINPIFPNKDARDANGKLSPIYPADLKIPAGATRLFSEYPVTLSPPFGTEIFKIFVSRKLIDMEGIADSRGAASRGSFTVLARLVKESYEMASRGEPKIELNNTDGSTFNVLFWIKEKKK